MDLTYFAVLNVYMGDVLVHQTLFNKGQAEFPGYIDSVVRGYEGTEMTVQVIDMINGGPYAGAR